jgi:hypothetical protein
MRCIKAEPEQKIGERKSGGASEKKGMLKSLPDFLAAASLEPE